MHLRTLFVLLSAAFLGAQEPVEMGPAPTREMFPLFLVGQAYQPVDPTPVGCGRWRVDLIHMRANTFEFSEILKDRVPRDPEGRATITQAYVEAHAQEYADQPMVFFFDEEITRLELKTRYGLTERTDIWLQVPVQSHSGGRLDSLIEGFHRLGFQQFGRDLVTPDQLTLVVMEHGKVTFFSQERIRAKLQDPTLGLTHTFRDQGPWRFAGYLSVKPPLTTAYGVYRSGWDPTLGFTARWQPGPRQVIYGGLGCILRTRGSEAYDAVQGDGFRNGLGAHLGWEWRPGGPVRPFIQLYWQSGWLGRQPGQLLDRPSLQHDLGFHWQMGRRTVFSLRYLNNLTHNANTADMGIGLSLSTRL